MHYSFVARVGFRVWRPECACGWSGNTSNDGTGRREAYAAADAEIVEHLPA